MHYRSGAQAVDQLRNTSLQVHLRRIHSWRHSTASLGIIFCRRSRQDVMYRALHIVTGSGGITRAAQVGQQHLLTALGSPAMEGGLTTPTSSHRNWTCKVGNASPKLKSCYKNYEGTSHPLIPLLAGLRGTCSKRGRMNMWSSGSLWKQKYLEVPLISLQRDANFY